jgi:hypothetical protein
MEEQEQDEGDASVPALPFIHPRPYGIRAVLQKSKIGGKRGY